jgi:hypothetical protein
VSNPQTPVQPPPDPNAPPTQLPDPSPAPATPLPDTSPPGVDPNLPDPSELPTERPSERRPDDDLEESGEGQKYDGGGIPT